MATCIYKSTNYSNCMLAMHNKIYCNKDHETVMQDHVMINHNYKICSHSVICMYYTIIRKTIRSITLLYHVTHVLLHIIWKDIICQTGIIANKINCTTHTIVSRILILVNPYRVVRAYNWTKHFKHLHKVHFLYA